MVNLYATKGITESFNVQILNESEPYILEDGEKIIFTVKYNVDDEAAVISKEITDGGEEGYYKLIISGEDTRDIEVGENGASILWYNLILSTNDGEYEAIETSPFTVRKSIWRV